ncbi:vWA domain-containing protein [Atopomonas hussainii]|uniref:vWA domain-containing protein n=1 Tax=Atopomonas hussainii TaxID=1429083 RepID=UPI0008FFFEE8|nr:VWA domain-containing protein [Atopomonas hussainii]
MLELAWPWAFLLLPLPWLLRQWLPPARGDEAALQISFMDELEQLSQRRALRPLPPWRRQLAPAGLWVLLLLALARPEWVGSPLPLSASGRDLLLAVDVSGSMQHTDMRWQKEEVTRLQLVKNLFTPFIESRIGDRVGLILFGSQAYLQAPLTFDRKTVSTWLDESVVNIAGPDTAIGDAIGLGIKRLRLRPAQARVLVLITDGANTAGQVMPMTAARLAREEGIRIYTIGIGSDASESPLLGMLGIQPGIDLDEPTLQAIAETTGGEYFRARNADELEGIAQTLDRLEPVNQKANQVRPVQPLYFIPLLIVLLSSLWLARPDNWRLLLPRRWR